MDLKPADVLDFYNTLYAKGLTGNTVLHYHVLLRKALKEAKVRCLIPSNPTDFIPRPKKEQFVSNCYSPEECRKLLDVLHGDPLELPIALAVLYGLRRSEVLGLRWSAVNFEQSTITLSHSVTLTAVDGKRQIIAKDKLKRKSSFRTLPLMPQVAVLLKDAASAMGYIDPRLLTTSVLMNRDTSLHLTIFLSISIRFSPRTTCAGSDFMIYDIAAPICLFLPAYC